MAAKGWLFVFLYSNYSLLVKTFAHLKSAFCCDVLFWTHVEIEAALLQEIQQVRAHMSLPALFILGLPPRQHGAFQRPPNPANLPHWTLKVAWSDLAWPWTGTRPVSHEDRIEKNRINLKHSTSEVASPLSQRPDVRSRTFFTELGDSGCSSLLERKSQVERKWVRLVETGSTVCTGAHTHPFTHTHSEAHVRTYSNVILVHPQTWNCVSACFDIFHLLFNNPTL